MRPASTHMMDIKSRAAESHSERRRRHVVVVLFSCAFTSVSPLTDLEGFPARALKGAVAACASMLLRARLDHSHTPGDHRSLGGHGGEMAMSHG
jgi:hypothetical protein